MRKWSLAEMRVPTFSMCYLALWRRITVNAWLRKVRNTISSSCSRLKHANRKGGGCHAGKGVAGVPSFFVRLRTQKAWLDFSAVTDSSSRPPSLASPSSTFTVIHSSDSAVAPVTQLALHTPSTLIVLPSTSHLFNIMALNANASLPAPAAPKKAYTGLDWMPFADDEIHPSEAYNVRIADLIERTKSAPPTTAFTLDEPSQVSPASTSENDESVTDDDLEELPLLSRSSSYPNQPTPFPPTPVRDYYTELKHAQRIYPTNARVLIGK